MVRCAVAAQALIATVWAPSADTATALARVAVRVGRRTVSAIVPLLTWPTPFQPQPNTCRSAVSAAL